MELKRNFYQSRSAANAFFSLQEEVFPGLDLAFALADCHLDQASIPYGLFDSKTAASAGSVQAVSILNATPLTILFGDQQYQAVQIGTVVAHPDWRRQGLSAKLLKQVLADFREQADFFFLFANKQVLNFYPRFGFTAVREHRFERPFSPGSNNLRQLNLTNSADRDFFRPLLQETAPISTQFGVANYNVLRDFSLNKFMSDAVWWDEAAELCVVAVAEEERLTIYDLIGKHLPRNYLKNLRWIDVNTLETRFTPNLFSSDFYAIPHKDDDDQLFVLINGENPELMRSLNQPFRVPALAKT